MIKRLCSEINKVEWSGVLFYDIISGDVDDPDNMILELKFIYPMDVGSAAETGFDYWEDTLDVYEWDESYEDMKFGLIHSHHNMNTFFSSTDKGELVENANQFLFYLSLIVNNTCLRGKPEFCARVAQSVTVEEEVNFFYKVKNKLGGFFKKEGSRKEESEKILWWDVEIQYPEEKETLPDIFLDRLEAIQSPTFRKPEVKVQQPSFFDDFDWNPNTVITKVTKDKLIKDFFPKLIEVDEGFKGDCEKALQRTVDWMNDWNHNKDTKALKDNYVDGMIQSFDTIWYECFGSVSSITDVQFAANVFNNSILNKYDKNTKLYYAARLVSQALESLKKSYNE